MILLRHYAGASWRHVADELGPSPDAARMLYTRALRELKRSLFETHES